MMVNHWVQFLIYKILFPFSGGGDMGGGENEGVEEDAGVEGQSWRLLPVCLIVITSNERK